MTQYCCRIDDATLLPMHEIGAGVYQCPKCTRLRLFKDGFVQRIGRDEAAEVLKNHGGGGLGLLVGGLAVLAIIAAGTR
jgi:hypothetical protein